MQQNIFRIGNTPLVVSLVSSLGFFWTPAMSHNVTATRTQRCFICRQMSSIQLSFHWMKFQITNFIHWTSIFYHIRMSKCFWPHVKEGIRSVVSYLWKESVQWCLQSGKNTCEPPWWCTIVPQVRTQKLLWSQNQRFWYQSSLSCWFQNFILYSLDILKQVMEPFYVLDLPQIPLFIDENGSDWNSGWKQSGCVPYAFFLVTAWIKICNCNGLLL